jgi:hypothetical protein
MEKSLPCLAMQHSSLKDCRLQNFRCHHVIRCVLQAAAEATEAEEEAKKLKLDGTEDSLKALIQKRSSSRAEQADNFFANLEAKYGQPQKKKKKK